MEINSAEMVSDRVAGRKAGTQNLRFVVWPDGEPAKIVTTTSKETGKPIKTEIARIPLWRCLANGADFKSWLISAFWLHVRFSMWHKWEFVPDVLAIRRGEKGATTLEAMTEVFGLINEKPGFTKEAFSKHSVLEENLPYDWNCGGTGNISGTFCFDKSDNKENVLNLGSVARLREAIANQLDNTQTTGSRDDSSRPKILFTPWTLHGTSAEKKESEEFAENFETFKSWAADPVANPPRAGKIVHWSLDKVPAQ